MNMKEAYNILQHEDANHDRLCMTMTHTHTHVHFAHSKFQSLTLVLQSTGTSCAAFLRNEDDGLD